MKKITFLCLAFFILCGIGCDKLFFRDLPKKKCHRKHSLMDLENYALNDHRVDGRNDLRIFSTEEELMAFLESEENVFIKSDPLENIDYSTSSVVYYASRFGRMAPDFRLQCYYCLSEDEKEVLLKIDYSLDETTQYGDLASCTGVYLFEIPKSAACNVEFEVNER